MMRKGTKESGGFVEASNDDAVYANREIRAVTRWTPFLLPPLIPLTLLTRLIVLTAHVLSLATDALDPSLITQLEQTIPWAQAKTTSEIPPSPLLNITLGRLPLFLSDFRYLLIVSFQWNHTIHQNLRLTLTDCVHVMKRACKGNYKYVLPEKSGSVQ